MKIQITKRAAQQIERANLWWREHRPESTELFVVEFHAVLDRLRTAPHSGQLYRQGRPPIRRIVMPQTRNHVYYRIAEENLVQVVTVWGAVRGRQPRL